MAELSPETLQFIRAHRTEDVRTLALQARKYPQVDMAAAVVQIAGWQIAEKKVPLWAQTEGIRYPAHLSMEQCSSEITARYKASWLKGDTMADLTGGLGVDCSFLARNFQRVDYVERQEVLCELARHNFPLLGLPQVTVHEADGVDYLRQMEPVDCLFLDPARRNSQGGKTVAIADCEPDVQKLEPLLVEKGRTVVVKLSPMLDIFSSLRELKYIRQIHVVAVNNECKELLVVLQKPEKSASEASGEVWISCEQAVNNFLTEPFVFTYAQEKEARCPLAEEVGNYLYEPGAALLKAGPYRLLGARFGLQKLHVNSHLYTSEALVDFPGRRFRVLEVSGFGKKELKQLLQGVDKANLTVRNFPASVAELRKKWKLKEGGDVYLFATTLEGDRHVVIKCVKA
ncbi:MAG TPA: SAM-dependent methyltransferase [Bacteroides mediterraneensis]|uniref:THUMP-like domain-containing protein n=1 Tax=Bacteroides mediterraneensis TaxID=1841856 RepID=UPI0026EE7778|nr:SAM-dependent methyltransferase [Bacteroides mediterraneensis]HJH66530.1 SAM-dependent methyltransferase [Bacteroides mediterraneensis]